MEKEIAELNNKFDMIISMIKKEREEREERKMMECSPVRPDIAGKTYEIVKRIDYENQKRHYDERIADIDTKIKHLTETKECFLREKEEAERRYYSEY